MRILRSAIAIATVFAAVGLAAPAWAHGDGHRHGKRHYGHPHGWDNHRHHSHRGYHRHYRPRVYSNYYYHAPPPVYAYPAPAPGVHIVVPNLYIPLR